MEREKTDWTTVRGGTLERAQARLRKALGDEGARVIELLSTDNKFVGRAAELLKRDALTEPRSWQVARHFLNDRFIGADWDRPGYNIFGVDEWRQCFGVTVSLEDAKRIGEFSWRPEILLEPCPFVPDKRVFETHAAVLGLDSVAENKPLTIGQWKELCPSRHVSHRQPVMSTIRPIVEMDTLIFGVPGQEEERFGSVLRTSLGWRWYLMPKVCLQVSPGEPFSKQEGLIPEGYEVARAVEEVTRRILVARTYGGPNEAGPYTAPVWCQETPSDDNQRVVVSGCDHSRHESGGCFGGGAHEARAKISLTTLDDRTTNQPMSHIGLALSRKPGC